MPTQTPTITIPLILIFGTYLALEPYEKELHSLKEFKNEHMDFRIYLCTGIFFKNRDKHEPAYTKIKNQFPEESTGKDAVLVSQKFMLANIFNCLKICQKYEAEKFYFKIREFASPGNFLCNFICVVFECGGGNFYDF